MSSGWSGLERPLRDAAAEQAGWERRWPAPTAGRGPLNRLTLERWSVKDPEETLLSDRADLAVPVIDGVPLFERLGQDWPGVPVGCVLPSSRHWFGSLDDPVYGRTMLLDGSCGVAECCGVIGRISMLAETVLWDQMYCHGHPPVPDGARFEFARESYEKEILGFARVQTVDWICP